MAPSSPIDSAIELREADQQDLHMPNLPVNPPAEVGDPEVWAGRERARLIEENRDLGLIDVELEGWFPFTTVLVTFQLSVDQHCGEVLPPY
ncbi:hypothetical protein [Rhodococcus sp. IEGM 1379]|uniref:hypothetical protein n=1 Tax=Rhodococcus sp. IEGM 1379 TaxID=3047086 RepID=UPI0024B84484|nr:hypothetical protein [Rhodococcus sp. IEGM 1379]MDI9914594.1 hypothetical protein [Rhodococcus sp. IEGM 1379]